MRIAQFIDIIKSSLGRTLFKNPAGYDEGTTVEDIGNNDFITKSMSSAISSGQDYKIPAGSPYPSVLTNGVEFITTATDLIVQCKIANPDVVNELTTNGAPTIIGIGRNSEGTLILTITIQTNEDPFNPGQVEQDTWVRII